MNKILTISVEKWGMIGAYSLTNLTELCVHISCLVVVLILINLKIMTFRFTFFFFGNKCNNIYTHRLSYCLIACLHVYDSHIYGKYSIGALYEVVWTKSRIENNIYKSSCIYNNEGIFLSYYNTIFLSFITICRMSIDFPVYH